MLEKFKKILENIKKKGNISLFSVLKMDDLTDKWSVFVCASWIDESNRKEIFSDIIKLIKDNMTTEESTTIARIVIASKDDHLIQELLEFKSGSEIGGEQSVKVNGNLIHSGYILESNKEA